MQSKSLNAAYLSPASGAFETDDGTPLADVADTIGPKPPNAGVVFVCCESREGKNTP